MNTFLRFPNGLKKALTLSYDDGVESDKKLIEIMKKNGILGTFNINGGAFAPEGKVYPAGTIHRRMSRSDVFDTYKDSGMEVAIHGYTHPYLEQLPPSLCTLETIKDREELEKMFSVIIRGMAYPYGTYNDTVIEILKNCGIVYSRTTKSTGNFALPEYPLTLHPTCHHDDPRLFELLDKFIPYNSSKPQLFYLWGHSYEFDQHNNWDLIEKFCELAGGHDDIWYATNIDIIDYINAYKSLVFSADCKRIFNPTAREIWIEINKETVKIAPGETVNL